MAMVEMPARLGTVWTRATRHPFLAGVRDGTVADAAFNAWLVQDRLFVGDLLWWQARLLARAPRAAQPVLVDGCGALVAELAWFDQLAADRDLPLTADAAPATLAYRELLRRLDNASVPVALAALWAIERVYLDAWRFAAPGAPPLREFVDHWTNAEFAAYVAALEWVADAHPAGPDGEAVVDEIVRLEARFWDSATDGGQQ